MKSTRPLSSLVLACLLTLSAHLFAAPAPAQGPPAGLTLESSAAGGAEVGDGPAAYSVSTHTAKARWLYFSLEYEAAVFDWENAGALPFAAAQGDPWNTLHQVTLGASYGGGLSERLNWFAALEAGSAFEEETADSFGGTANGGLGYAFTQSLSATVGAFAFAHPVSAGAMPIVSLAWQQAPDHGWYVKLGFPANDAGYVFSPGTLAGIAAGGGGGTWRLADDNTAVPAGYAVLDQKSLFLHGSWQALEALNISARLGVLYDREIRLRGEDPNVDYKFDFWNFDDHKGSRYDTDDTWFAALEAGVSL